MKKTTLKLFLLAFLILLSFLLHSTATYLKHEAVSATLPSSEAKVIYVIDGDTFKTVSGDKVRLIGIDAPEKGECYYEEAKEALKRFIDNKQVTLKKDKSETDKYGRLLRYVYTDIFVNQKMVEGGFAKAKNYPPDNTFKGLLESAQLQAKLHKKGLWSCKKQ